MNKVTFKSKKEATEFLKEKGINTSNWTEEKWQSINKSQAEIHIQALAEAMWDAYNESIPKKLKAGEYHIPFGDRFDNDGGKFVKYLQSIWRNKQAPTNGNTKERIKIATARCARLSYMTFDGEIDYEKDIKLHDRLLESCHASPFEHVSRCLTEEEYNALGKMILDPVKGYIFEKGWVDNFKGFVSYRRILNF